MKLKGIAGQLLAFVIEVGVYLLLYSLASTYIFGTTTPQWTETMQYVWYAFFVIAGISNMFHSLLYLQIIFWGILCKFIYFNDLPVQSIGMMVIGLVAIVVNICIRRGRASKSPYRETCSVDRERNEKSDKMTN